MSAKMFNLLTEAFITTTPLGPLTLPGVLAALSRDEIEDFPALRVHQGMFWHMFLVQLAALTLHRAGKSDLPEDEETWCNFLRRLTPEYPDDEPWCLVVSDWSKPAFMQAAVPGGVRLENRIPSPDALDMLITAKNHDLKQSTARLANPEDWLFALVSLQTGEGYGGRGNHGIARMNGGSSSRPMLTLAPVSGSAGRATTPRLGAWFLREVRVLIGTRNEVLERSNLDYARSGGVGLTWLVPWPEKSQLRTRDLDIWFIEICRRVRLGVRDGVLHGLKGTSEATRIDAKQFNGALDDPWAPVHKTENKSLTLSGGEFDYRRLTDLLFSGNWVTPILAQPSDIDVPGQTLAVVASALSRGNSKTEGFKSRVVPLTGRVTSAIGPRRAELHELAKAQVETIAFLDRALGNALALAAAEGNGAKDLSNYYDYTKPARTHFIRFADEIFFHHLWARFEAQDMGLDARRAEEQAFAGRLWQRMQTIFEQSLPSMPCGSLFRPRAEARARALLRGTVRKHYPDLLSIQQHVEAITDAA